MHSIKALFIVLLLILLQAIYLEQRKIKTLNTNNNNIRRRNESVLIYSNSETTTTHNNTHKTHYIALLIIPFRSDSFLRFFVPMSGIQNSKYFIVFQHQHHPMVDPTYIHTLTLPNKVQAQLRIGSGTMKVSFFFVINQGN